MGSIAIMTVEITLNLPDRLVEQAQHFSSATQRDVGTVLADTLELLWLTVEEFPSEESWGAIAELPDDEVLVLAASKMDEVQYQRLGTLQSKGKRVGLTDAERYELLTLLRIYQLGQLRKSEALAEAVDRGLREPLSPYLAATPLHFPY